MDAVRKECTLMSNLKDHDQRILGTTFQGRNSIDKGRSKRYSCCMIRKARISDVRSIQALVNAYADQGQMLPRSLNELYEGLRDFSVYETEGLMGGVCALHISWDGLAEIRSLAVQKEMTGKGIGSNLVKECLREAGELGATRVFVLTYQEGFFRKLGFESVDKKDLPHKIWTDCLNCVKFPNCDESSLIITLPQK
jgi:amino-acid N-acetyltransferase